MATYDAPLPGRVGLVGRLNTTQHRFALNVFMLVVLAHWAEHIAQAIEIWKKALNLETNTRREEQRRVEVEKKLKANP